MDIVATLDHVGNELPASWNNQWDPVSTSILQADRLRTQDSSALVSNCL